MEIHVGQTSSKGIDSFVISHSGKAMEWTNSPLYNAAVPSHAKLFDDINYMLGRLTPEQQDRIWELYVGIYTACDQRTNVRGLIASISASVKEIYSIVKYRDLSTYVRSGAVIFPELKDSYGPKDVAEWTYLRNDYEELVILVLALHLMVPVWSLLIVAIGKDVGRDHKEMVALSVILGSSVVEYPGYIRMYDYFEVGMASAPTTVSSLIGGIPSSKLPWWIMSTALIRRITVSSIQYSVERESLVVMMFNHVNSTRERLPTRISGWIDNKKPPSGNSSSKAGDSQTVFDMFRGKSAMSRGELAIVKATIGRLRDMALLVENDPDVYRKAKLCYRHLRLRSRSQTRPLNVVGELHIRLAKWVVGHVIPPKVISDYLDKKKHTCAVLAVAQAVLWHRGYIELAVLVTADRDVSDDYGYLTQVTSRQKVPQDLVEQLQAEYSVYRVTSTRKSDPTKVQAKGCLVLNEINAMFEDIVASNWRVSCPEELAKAFSGRTEGSAFGIGPTFRPDVARFILEHNAKHRERKRMKPAGAESNAQ